jgi:hypothetical protein
LLLREVEKRTGIIQQFAACFRDHRQAERIEHGVEELVAQRVYGLALGYEDLNDHEELRRDPLLGVLAGKADRSGESRSRPRDRGKALAGKSTLNRLELTGKEVKEGERYKKIGLDFAAGDQLFGKIHIQAHGEPPKQIVLDLDSTDDPLCTGIKKGDSFTAIMGTIAICPGIFSVGSTCCARGCVRRMAMGRREGWRNSPAGCSRFGRRGRRCGSLKSSALKRARVGRERGAWWPRPNIWRRARIHAWS